MATLALGVLAGPGFLGANAFWTSVLMMAGGFIDQRLFAPKMPGAEGARLDDLKLTTSTYGAAIPIVYGKIRIPGNIIWGTDYVEHKHEEHVGGGKGGGGGSTQTTYTYTISFAVALGQGPIAGFERVWADGKLIDLAGVSYTFYSGSEEQNPDPFVEAVEGTGNVPAYRGLCYIVFRNFDVTNYGNRIPSFSFEVVSGRSSNLARVIEEISHEAGLGSDRVDASDLVGAEIPGMTLDGDRSFRERIEPLMLVYLFDACERNGQVVFKRRVIGDNVISIPAADMGAYESAPPADLFEVTRKPEMELPSRLWVEYLSADKEYQAGGMPAYRTATCSRNEVKVQLPMALNDAWAKTIAETRLFEMWTARSTLKTTLPIKYWYLLPGDPVEFSLRDGRKRLMLISGISAGKPGLATITAVDVGKTTYTIIERNADPETASSPAAAATPVRFEILDLPRLMWDAAAGEPFAYTAACASVYYGANLFRSDDGGSSWSLVQQTDRRAAMGETLNRLEIGPAAYFDEGNSIEVALVSGSLSSRPEADIYAGFNAAVIGGEILQFRSAELIGEGTYRLSGLLRGRCGTEDQIPVHRAGDRFILLNTATISRINIPAGDIGASRRYRFGPAMLPADHGLYAETSLVYTGRAMKPWSVSGIRGVRCENGELGVSWTRRSRSGSGWLDYIDVPLGESREGYEVDVMNGDAVVRTLRVDVPAATYTAEQQLADFGTVQATVLVVVYQMSEQIGRGIPKTASV